MHYKFVSAPHPRSDAFAASTCQAIVVDADSDAATIGELQCWEREAPDQPWHPSGNRIPVSLGRSGMVPGNGMLQWMGGPLKREGDGKTPIGLFTIDMAYGYASPAEAHFVKLPYLQVSAHHFCVEDPKSRHYNRIVDERLVSERDWNSAEDMLRNDHLYQWGIVPGYNSVHVDSGGGSCIFLHLWRNPESPTEGCTAMALPNMEQLLAWLDPLKYPILIQATSALLPELISLIGLKR